MCLVDYVYLAVALNLEISRTGLQHLSVPCCVQAAAVAAAGTVSGSLAIRQWWAHSMRQRPLGAYTCQVYCSMYIETRHTV